MLRREISLYSNNGSFFHYELQNSIKRMKVIAELEHRLAKNDENNSYLTRKIEKVVRENQILKESGSKKRSASSLCQTPKKAFINASRYLEGQNSLKRSRHEGHSQVQCSTSRSKQKNNELKEHLARIEDNLKKSNLNKTQRESPYLLKSQNTIRNILQQGNPQENSRKNTHFLSKQHLIKNENLRTEIDKVRELMSEDASPKIEKVNKDSDLFPENLSKQKQNSIFVSDSKLNNLKPEFDQKSQTEIPESTLFGSSHWMDRTDYCLKNNIKNKAPNQSGRHKKKVYLSVVSIGMRSLNPQKAEKREESS